MKVLVDMNLSPRWVDLLNHAGWNATHWSNVGKSTASDHEVMQFALANDYVVLPHDLDFSTILATTHGRKPSVVQLRTDNLNLGIIGDPVLRALNHLRAELERGALVTIDPLRTRIRLLPLLPEGDEV